MILIKDGRIIDPKRGIDDVLDIVIDGGKIAKIGKYQKSEEYETIIDAKGMVVAPGLVDVHVHFRDPGLTYKEDIQTGANAAKKGGFTTVVTMANTKPAVDNVETVKYIIEEGKKTGINVMPAACITVGMQGKELVDMEALIAAGAAGFTDDGIPIMDQNLVKTAMLKAKELNVPLSFHEEDPAFISENGINAGPSAEALGIKGSPSLAEDSLVARDCMLALHTGANVNIQHISSKNAVKMVKLAKELGANVWAEVTPHHIALDESAVLEKGSLAKMNPPLRSVADRYGIIEGIKDGSIDMIATDHAPHSPEEKAVEPVWKAPSGIIGLETALGIAVTNLVRKGHLTMIQLMEKMSLNPSRLYNFDKGYIDEGADADLVIFDENEKWTVSMEDIASKSCNTPFIGTELYGRVKYTICAGEVVYQDK